MADRDSASAISVSNLVNLSNLERVFGEIFEKLSSMNQRIDTIESNLASNVSLTRFLSLKNEYESNMNLFENRIKYLETNVSELKPNIQRTGYNQENIDKLREKSKQWITTEMFESSLNDIEETMNHKMEQISSTKCSNERSKKLEESTKDICAQISAMESLIQCKVDKSQIPLIESCQKQLDGLERFRDQISQRVCVIDDQISDVTNDMTQKVEQSIFDETTTDIGQRMMSKVDMAFLNEEVIKRLNALLPDLLVLLKEHKQISTSQCFDEIKTMNGSIKEMTERLHVNKRNIENILKSLYDIPSLQQMQIKADKEFCTNLSEEGKAFCTNMCKGLDKNIGTINKEIDKLKIITNSLNEKTKVALRFVDWYSSLQLES
eukprot:491834_1